MTYITITIAIIIVSIRIHTTTFIIITDDSTASHRPVYPAVFPPPTQPMASASSRTASVATIIHEFAPGGEFS